MVRRQFAVSTHLYHHQRLTRDHILEIAAHGFDEGLAGVLQAGGDEAQLGVE